MSRKTTAALLAALGINFALAGGALMLANLNTPTEYDFDEAFATTSGGLETVANKHVDPAAGHLAVPLKAAQQGGNMRVTFTAAKSTPAGREVHEGTWDQIAGGILYNPEAQKLLAIEAAFDTRSLRTDAHGLTNTVTAKEKWFDIDNHPIAIFKCDEINPLDASTSSHTHDLVGSFTLNGITRPLTIPAAIAFSGQSLTLDASFTILRSVYNVEKRESSVAGSVGGVVSKVEDEVELTVRVTASPDPTAVIRELAQAIQSQEERMRIAEAERKRLEPLLREVELLHEKIAGLKAAGPTKQISIDVASLPHRFTDHAEGNGGPFPFEMTLVSGDPDGGVAPFYMSTHEVAWGMVDKWMYAGDLDQQGLSANEIAKLIKAGKRPSPLYEEPAQLVCVRKPDRPAMAMSLVTAKAYCEWLSEKTGRHYRLPTINEWRFAMKAGGGMPSNLHDAVLHKGNIKFDDFGRDDPGPIGARQPNALGIHDMFGSVAEWVTGTGKDRVVVGASFQTPIEEFKEDWQDVESLDVWSENYPQLPKSRFWYSDFYAMGIRLVCEPASVVANPPVEE